MVFIGLINNPDMKLFSLTGGSTSLQKALASVRNKDNA
jgi:hypothetical protein